MIKKLLHTRYRVTDLEKTVAFYRDVLGLEETRRHTSGRGSQLVFFKAPGSEEEIEICKYDQSGPVVVGPDLTVAGMACQLPAMATGVALGSMPPQRIRCLHARIGTDRLSFKFNVQVLP